MPVVGVKKAVSDYEELAKDPDVDIVYVSNIHPAHKDTRIIMLDHGKHVLCEKPLAVSSASTQCVSACHCPAGLLACHYFIHQTI